jgi:hypothetical protein
MAEIRVPGERSIVLAMQQSAVAPGNDQQPAISREVDTHRERGEVDPGDHLLAPRLVDRHHLLPAPVREPQATVMPARRLAERHTLQEHLWIRHR